MPDMIFSSSRVIADPSLYLQHSTERENMQEKADRKAVRFLIV